MWLGTVVLSSVLELLIRSFPIADGSSALSCLQYRRVRWASADGRAEVRPGTWMAAEWKAPQRTKSGWHARIHSHPFSHNPVFDIGPLGRGNQVSTSRDYFPFAE